MRTVALVTAMDRPLGRTAGNAVEVAESVEVLAGGGPADVIELTLALAREMLAGAGVPTSTPPMRWPTGARWTSGADDRRAGRRSGRAAAGAGRDARGDRPRPPAR